jgi:hypothetical protein
MCPHEDVTLRIMQLNYGIITSDHEFKYIINGWHNRNA